MSLCDNSQSKNVMMRLAGHAGKDFHSARMVQLPPSELSKVEAAFIRLLQPALNVRGVIKSVA